MKNMYCNWLFLLWIEFCFALICLELTCGVHCVNDISPLCVVYRVLLNVIYCSTSCFQQHLFYFASVLFKQLKVIRENYIK